MILLSMREGHQQKTPDDYRNPQPAFLRAHAVTDGRADRRSEQDMDIRTNEGRPTNHISQESRPALSANLVKTK